MFETKIPQSEISTISRIDSELIEAIYSELKHIATWHLSAVNKNITLGPTDLTHEAIGRVLRQRKDDWNNESHLLAVASLMVRRVLMTHLRMKSTQKRGGKVTTHRVMYEPQSTDSLSPIDLLCLCEAIDGLEERQASVVQMKVFGGMKTARIAEFLGVSERTVQLEWNHARLWLARELKREH